MERIHIVKKSVTKLDVDCVVNAANEGLWAGGGVCGAIFKEAGYNELTDACNEDRSLRYRKCCDHTRVSVESQIYYSRCWTTVAWWQS